MKEDYQAVLEYAGHGKKVVGFPAAPAIWGLRVLDELSLSPSTNGSSRLLPRTPSSQ